MANLDQVKFANKSTAEGAMKRPPTKFHDTIYTKAENPNAEFVAEAGRYRLFVCYACPWAHRTMIMRKLKGLEEVIGLTATGYRLPNLKLGKSKAEGEYKGWEFTPNEGGDHVLPEYCKGFTFLKDLYELAQPGYTEEFKRQGKRAAYSVPVLFDEKTKKIVTNESAEIIILFNTVFNDFATNPELDLNFADDESIQQKMNEVNAIVYPGINDGVYRCGFAMSQEAYQDAYKAHWEAMDKIEAILGENKFLCGDMMTLSDIRLFVTLIRYDPVYYGHFKTSRNKITEMPNMLAFVKRIYNMDGIKDTVRTDYYVKHYYESHRVINPTGIWPMGALEKDYLKYLEE